MSYTHAYIEKTYRTPMPTCMSYPCGYSGHCCDSSSASESALVLLSLGSGLDVRDTLPESVLLASKMYLAEHTSRTQSSSCVYRDWRVARSRGILFAMELLVSAGAELDGMAGDEDVVY